MRVAYMCTTSQCRGSIPRYQSVFGLHLEPAFCHRAEQSCTGRRPTPRLCRSRRHLASRESCSLQTTAVRSSFVSSVCHQRESRTADNNNDDALPAILPSAVRDPGCTTPGCLEPSLAGCLQRKDSRRPSKERVSLDPVPWESSGSLNAGRHGRGSGRTVQIVPPFRALVQQAPGSSTLGCISRNTLPNDDRPQASVPSVRSRREYAWVVSQGHGQMHLAMDADRDLVSHCARPQLQLHTPTRSLPLLSPLGPLARFRRQKSRVPRKLSLRTYCGI